MKNLCLILILAPLLSIAQKQAHPGEIKLRLKKLNFLGSVLYVAAHPDDENTRIITAMANERLAASAYLSMTRGDGGQNLIGPELRDELGLIRTQELLAARRIDGGEQFFTRANDFGFSKSPDETFKIWNKDSILHDVVKVFREYQPDVIITRFPPDERAGHGHHTASAMLALEAFDVAAQSDKFPSQAKQLGTWQPKRLYTNTGRWWNTSINENTPGVIAIDVGGYNALLGESMSEIAAVSRSQHKSQGFGSRGTRGRQLEYLEYQKGERASKDIFEGVNTTWSRLRGGEKIPAVVNKIIAAFDEENPAKIVPMLFDLRKQITALSPGVWRDRKLREVESLIEDCLGLYVEAIAEQYWVAPGQDFQINFEVVNRSNTEISLLGISASALTYDSTTSVSLKHETPLTFKTVKTLPVNSTYSQAYWLREPHDIGRFTVTDRALIGKGFNDPAVSFSFRVRVGKDELIVKRPLVYKWTDPVKGELSRPFEVVPPLFVNVDQRVIIFPDMEPKTVNVLLKSSGKGSLQGTLSLDLPEGWRAEPSSITFELTKAGEEQIKPFRVYPSRSEVTATLRARAEINGKAIAQGVKVISYDHIPAQTLLPPAEIKVVRVDLKENNGTIAYLKGAGDEIPSALRNMGYNVIEMRNEDVTLDNLKNIDAVVLGIRALNTNERIRFMMGPLLQYVENGGTLVVQYNTSFDLGTDQYAPYPLTISRDRVTDENAPVTILNPDHPVINYPNKINASDFESWVQERGLYFPGKRDDRYEAILSMHDPGEQPKDGSLLIAPYGKGYYVYTGISFFRQLPEGVSGAYKLFANMISLSKSPSPAVEVNAAPSPETKSRKRAKNK